MYLGVSKGLRLVFFSEIAVFACAFLGGALFMLPAVAFIIVGVGALACGVVSVVGIYKISASLEETKPAFALEIVRIVVGLIHRNISGSVVAGAIAGIVETVLATIILFFIVKVTAAELGKNGNAAIEYKGNNVWLFGLAVNMVTVLMNIITMFQIGGSFSTAISVLVAFAALAWLILYLVYLNNAAKAFDELYKDMNFELV